MNQLSLFGLTEEVTAPAKKQVANIDNEVHHPKQENLQEVDENLLDVAETPQRTQTELLNDAIPGEVIIEEEHELAKSIADKEDDSDENVDVQLTTLEEETTVESTEETFVSAEPQEPVVEFFLAPQQVQQPAKTPLKTTGKRGRKSFKEIDAEVDLIEVPGDEELFKKQYYSITIVAKWFRVNNSLLRYWENEFDILQPRKTRKGDRLFRPEDVKNLQVIYYLLRQRKFSIEGAKKYLKANKKGVDTNLQIIQALTKFRSFLLEMKANLGK